MALFHSPPAIGFLSRLGCSPVVERELRVGARRAGTYWGRVGAALTAIVVTGWWFAGMATMGVTPQSGRTAFRVLAILAALMVVTSVISLTADSFAREKREDTLGLLFLTPLKPWDLVLGKLTSSSLGAFYRFVAVVPVLALPIIGGGVTLGQFLLLVIVLSNLAFFTASLGLFVSANCWDEKRAGTAASITFLGLTIILPCLIAALAGSVGGRFSFAFLFASPAYPVWQATVMGFGWSPALWCSLLLTHLTGWLFLRATWRLLPHCWQARPGLQPRPGFVRAQPIAARPPVPAVNRARHAVRRQFHASQRTAMLDWNPILWFAQRWRADAAAAWIVGAIAFVGFIGVGMARQFEAYLSPEFALGICYCFNAALKTYVCEQAALAFARDRAENSLELLVATPLSVRELTAGYVQALSHPMRRIVLRTLAIETGWLLVTLLLKTDRGPEGIGLSIAMGVAVLAMLIPDLYAVGWAALWAGAVAKDSRTGASNAVLKVLCLPWLFPFGIVVLMRLFGWSVSPWLLLVSLVIGSFFMDWWSIHGAQRRLVRELPNLAQRRTAGEVEFFSGWERPGRWLGRLWREMFP